MKIFTLAILILVLLFIANLSHAQNIDWVITGGSQWNDQAGGLAADPQGNLFQFVSIGDTATQYGFLQTIYHPQLRKIDPAGNLLITSGFPNGGGAIAYNDSKIVALSPYQIKYFDFNCNLTDSMDVGGDWVGFWNEYYNSVAIDNSDNVYISGTHTEYLQENFQPLKSFHNPVVSIIDSSKTILYHASGEWGHNYGGAVITGDQHSFYNASFMDTSNSLIYKMNATCQIEQAFGNHPMGINVRGMITDNQNNIYACGNIGSVTTLNGQNFSSTPPSVINGYIAKFDSLGSLTWLTQLSSQTISQAIFIKQDSNGFIYVAGSFTSDLEVGGTNITSWYPSIFVGCFNQNGQLMWIQNFWSEMAMGVNDLLADQSNNIYLTGTFDSIAHFGNTYLSNGMYDYYILKINNSNVGIEAEHLSSSMQVFPNPCDNRLQFSFTHDNGKSNKEIILIDAEGRVIKSEKITSLSSSYQMDMGSISDGIYTALLRSGDEILSKEKVTVMHH